MRITIAFLVTVLVLAGTLAEARPLPASRGGFRTGGLARVGPATSHPEGPPPPRTSSVTSPASTIGQTPGETVPAAGGPNTGQGNPAASSTSGANNGGGAAADGGNGGLTNGGFNPNTAGADSSRPSGTGGAHKLLAGLSAWVQDKGGKQFIDNTAAGINSGALALQISGQGLGAHMASQQKAEAAQAQKNANAAAATASTSSTASSSSPTPSSPSQRRSFRASGGRSSSSAHLHSDQPSVSHSAAPPYDPLLHHGGSSGVGNAPGSGPTEAGGNHLPPTPEAGSPGSQVGSGQQIPSGGAAPSKPSSEAIPLSSKLGLGNAVTNFLNGGIGLSAMGVNQYATTEKDHAGQQQQQQGAATTNSTASNSTNSQAAPAAATSSAMNWDFSMPVGLVA